MPGAIARAKEIVASDPAKYFMPSQFDNPANPQIHEQTTGPEIWRDTEGGIDVLVSGVGTGGTITGVSRYIKRTQGKAITSIAVEPDTSNVIAAAKFGGETRHAPHKIQGIGAGFLPANLDLQMVDQVESVTSEEAIEWAHRLMKEEGILAGISSGAAVAVADRISREDAFKGKQIVVILPDSAERYLSSALFEGTFSENETVQQLPATPAS
jgi:cysteine synthase A